MYTTSDRGNCSLSPVPVITVEEIKLTQSTMKTKNCFTGDIFNVIDSCYWTELQVCGNALVHRLIIWELKKKSWGRFHRIDQNIRSTLIKEKKIDKRMIFLEICCKFLVCHKWINLKKYPHKAAVNVNKIRELCLKLPSYYQHDICIM